MGEVKAKENTSPIVGRASPIADISPVPGEGKATSAGRQRTWLALTPAGRAAFSAHARGLRTLLASADMTTP